MLSSVFIVDFEQVLAEMVDFAIENLLTSTFLLVEYKLFTKIRSSSKKTLRKFYYGLLSSTIVCCEK